MTRALMWEARAAEGRAAELERWVREEVLPGLRAAAPDRLELLTAEGDRVLLITWWTGEPAHLPDPPDGLTARPVHRWSFTRAHVE
ncbi:hypothetical protein [Kitasatospora arboriphila]|uniref:ABM domain-containing protein n=1 Tax=Kitasatospora arboriphila TaxID=258052 RepID=A0ABN1TAV1_9ACTN